MKSKIFARAALALPTALILSGCLQQVWEVRYQGPDNSYSAPGGISVDQAGNIAMLGSIKPIGTNQHDAYVALYSPSGSLLWDLILPESSGHLSSIAKLKKPVASHADFGLAVLTSPRNPQTESVLTKISPSGEILGQMPSETFDWGSVHFDNEGNLYWYKAGFALTKLDEHGDALWTVQLSGPSSGGSLADEIGFGDSDLPPRGLDTYLGRAVNESQQRTRLQSSSVLAISPEHFQFDADNNALLNTGQLLLKLTPAGERILEVDAAALDMSIIQAFDQIAGSVAVMGIGASNNLTVLRILDDQFALQTTTDLGPARAYNRLAAGKNSGFCFMSGDYTEQSTAAYTVGYFSLDLGVVWSESQDHPGYSFAPHRVASDNNHCYFSYTDAPGTDSNPTTHYVDRFTHAGKALKPVKLDAAIGADFVVDRSHIITAAMQGEYDGSRTVSLLVKHRMR